MKRIWMVIILLDVGLKYVFAEDIPDTPGDRQAAAERYLDVAPMDSIMRDMIEKTSQNLPEGQRKQFVELMTKYVRVSVLERAALSSMVRHFSVRELNALADFYGSQEGRSAMKKFGSYMADVMPVIQQEMARAVKQYNEVK